MKILGKMHWFCYVGFLWLLIWCDGTFFKAFLFCMPKNRETGNEFSPKSLSFQKFLSSSSSKQHNFHITNWRLKYRHLKSQEIHLKRKTPKKSFKFITRERRNMIPNPNQLPLIKKAFYFKRIEMEILKWKQKFGVCEKKTKQKKEKKNLIKTKVFIFLFHIMYKNIFSLSMYSESIVKC